MKNKLCLTLFLISVFSIAQAQIKKDTLSWDGFLDIIRQNHPITIQAKLLNNLSKARKTQALGGFDPKLEVDYDRKLFDGTEYYTFLTPQVKLPLWYGLELKASYTEAEGAFINPENKVPTEGLSFVGLNVALGKGLLMDKRRAAFLQAKIFEKANNNEQINLLNNLFKEAGETYINWQNTYQVALIFENALALAQVRLEAVTTSYKQGDRAAIDTLEALTQVQQREIQLQQAKLELQNAVYDMSTFMWLENAVPIDPEKLNIQPTIKINLPLIPIASVNNNPKLLSYNFKLQDLNIERRLKAENLRPEIGLQLGMLNTGRSPLNNLNPTFWNNNNKVGIRFAFPLTFAAARGELTEAKLKIKNTQLEQELIKNDLQNKLRQNNTEISTLNNQLLTLKQSFNANNDLLKGEELRLKYGESSLFLVNARESKLIEVQEKLLDTEAKISKAKLKAIWLTGGVYQ